MMLFTKEIKRKMDKFPIKSQEKKGDDAEVICKLFNPYGGQRWYVLEAGEVQPDGDRELFVFLTCAGETEYGYMMMSDFVRTKVKVAGLMMPLERDRWFSGTVADAKEEM